jgi:hypothetical protein
MMEVSSTELRSEMAAMAPMVLDFAKLLEGVPPGAWVAVSADGERVVAYSAEMQQAIRLAIEAGEDRPLVFRVPSTPSTFVF